MEKIITAEWGLDKRKLLNKAYLFVSVALQTILHIIYFHFHVFLNAVRLSWFRSTGWSNSAVWLSDYQFSQMDMDFLLHGITLCLVTSFAEECIRFDKRLFSSTQHAMARVFRANQNFARKSSRKRFNAVFLDTSKIKGHKFNSLNFSPDNFRVGVTGSTLPKSFGIFFEKNGCFFGILADRE